MSVEDGHIYSYTIVVQQKIKTFHNRRNILTGKIFGNKIVADFVSNVYLFRNEIKIKKNNLTWVKI